MRKDAMILAGVIGFLIVIVAFIRLIAIQTTVDKQANRMAKMDG